MTEELFTKEKSAAMVLCETALKHCQECIYAEYRNPKFHTAIKHGKFSFHRVRRQRQGTIRCTHPDIDLEKNNVVVNTYEITVNIKLYGACKLGNRKTNIL